MMSLLSFIFLKWQHIAYLPQMPSWQQCKHLSCCCCCWLSHSSFGVLQFICFATETNTIKCRHSNGILGWFFFAFLFIFKWKMYVKKDITLSPLSFFSLYSTLHCPVRDCPFFFRIFFPCAITMQRHGDM